MTIKIKARVNTSVVFNREVPDGTDAPTYLKEQIEKEGLRAEVMALLSKSKPNISYRIESVTYTEEDDEMEWEITELNLPSVLTPMDRELHRNSRS